MSKKPIIALSIFALLIFLFAWFFRDIFSYFLISTVFAAILTPIIHFIANKLYLPKSISIILAVLVVFTFMALLIATFVPLVSEQIRIIRNINIEKTIDLIRSPLTSLHNSLTEMQLITTDTQSFETTIKEHILGIAKNIQVSEIFNTLFSITGSIFISILAVFFITFFLVNNPSMIKNGLLNLISNQYFEISVNALYKIEYLLGRYFRGIFIQMFFIFSIAYVGLSLANVNYAATIALFAAIINLIPYAGPLLGAIFGIMIGLSTSIYGIGSSEFNFLVVKICIVFGIVQITDNLALQPIIFSKSLKAHPLEIFVIIFVGANLGGAIGMILAMPFYTIIKVSISELLRGYRQYKVFNKI